MDPSSGSTLQRTQYKSLNASRNVVRVLSFEPPPTPDDLPQAISSKITIDYKRDETDLSSEFTATIFIPNENSGTLEGAGDVKVQSTTVDSIYEQKESQGKCLGIFATRNIFCGTRILAEAGVLKVNKDTTDAWDIIHAFERLSSSQEKSYLGLHEYACDLFKRATEREIGQDWEKVPQLHRKVLAIWDANSFGDIFLTGSRINHLCIPNVHFAYNLALEKQTFHAIRNIEAGEEITIMYINGTNRTRDQRQNELGKWGFSVVVRHARIRHRVEKGKKSDLCSASWIKNSLCTHASTYITALKLRGKRLARRLKEWQPYRNQGVY
jgi:preprotein translocase subunit SecB